MKISVLISLFTLIISLQSFAQEKAPNFTLRASDGSLVKLSDYKDKIVIIEWLNHGCPFIRKHYDSNNMQSTQRKVLDKNTVWLSIISSAEGKQGYVTAEEAEADKKLYNSEATKILLDTTGSVGQAFGAKTTPHMFVLNKRGYIVYDGAIDSIASADKDDIAKAENYIIPAVDALKRSEEVKTKKTKPYGCSVKY